MIRTENNSKNVLFNSKKNSLNLIKNLTNNSKYCLILRIVILQGKCPFKNISLSQPSTSLMS